jgi:uncharacterized protein YigA (DUF484 family)
MTPDPKENRGVRLAVVEQALREATEANSALASQMTAVRRENERLQGEIRRLTSDLEYANTHRARNR